MRDRVLETVILWLVNNVIKMNRVTLKEEIIRFLLRERLFGWSVKENCRR